MAAPAGAEAKADIKESKGVYREPPAIKTFNARLSEMPKFVMKAEWNIKGHLAAKLGIEIKSFSLGKPAVLDGRCLVGTDSSGTNQHFAMCFDVSSFDHSRRDIILGSLALTEEVHDIQWVHHELAISAVGEGKLQLLTISNTNDITLHGTLPTLHSGAIREIAINQGSRAQFASGGADRKLCLVDLERPDALQTIKQDGVIGSVRWPLCNQNVCPSVTLDDGTFLIYDIRVRPIGPPAFKATMGKKELFAHERYTDHNVILGFGDGEMQHIDVRITDRILHKVQDPFVQAIGALEYNSAKGLLLISGMPEMGVWKHDVSSGESRCWSRFFEERGPAPGADAHNSTFANEDTVVTCTSSGSLALHKLKA